MSYLGARGIKFHRHPGAHLKKKPGRWIVCAELVETTRLFGRGIANIEPLWIEQVAGHLLKKQLLDPHWEKKAAEVMSLERATLYGLVVYSGRRVPFARVDLQGGARDLHPRRPGGGPVGNASCRSWPPTGSWCKQVEELEHKSRRQDVLVDEELIYAFYDKLIPPRRVQRRQLRALVPRSRPRTARSAETDARRADAARGRRHHDRGVSRTMRLGGVDCAAAYLHEPGDTRDGLTVTRAAVRAEPGERGARRVAGARHAQGQGAGPAQEPAAEARARASFRCPNRRRGWRRSCRNRNPGPTAR